ncbi:MAG: transglycosylase SLT domain-containing protein [Rugosibacter sp.]|jgi:membrane-bound lytic murein transglycosylase D
MRPFLLSCLFLLLLTGCQTTSVLPAPPPDNLTTRPPSNEAKSTALSVPDDAARIPLLDLTTQPDDLWQRVRNGFAMPDLDNKLVADRQAWYLNRPDFLRTLFNRSRRYLYHIVSELDKRGMPTELALLPIVESAYNPQARSPASAEGLWQFIPSTGKYYNLKQNDWFDERRDVIASTNAALDYLQYIYEMHGDWQLALASYNWGEGAVGRAIAKNQAKGLPADYAHLTMPEETRYYVPKLQALKNILANPALFNFTLDPIPNQPYFQMIERTGDMDVAIAARLAEIPVTEFLALNPAYKRPIMPDSANSPLVIPSDKAKRFLANLADYEARDKPLASWRTHTLGRGEKLAGVARRYGVSVAYLQKINGLNKRSKTYPGLGLLVPGKGAVITDEMVAVTDDDEPPSKARQATKRGKATDKKSHTARIKKPAAKTGKKNQRVSVSITGTGSKAKPAAKRKKTTQGNASKAKK